MRKQPAARPWPEVAAAAHGVGAIWRTAEGRAAWGPVAMRAESESHLRSFHTSSGIVLEESIEMKKQAGRPGLLPSFLHTASGKAAAALHLDELSSEPVKLQQAATTTGELLQTRR